MSPRPLRALSALVAVCLLANPASAQQIIQVPASGAEAAAATEAVVTVYLNMRREPAAGAAILTVIPEGTRVPVYRCTPGYGWCAVGYGGQVGWVGAQFLMNEATRAPIANGGGVPIGETVPGGVTPPGPAVVQAPAPAPTPQNLPPLASGQFCFYADANYRGGMFCGTEGQINPALSDTWRDRISSVRVGPNGAVQACSDNQFRGTCATFDHDLAELPANLNNAISSFRSPPPVVAQAPEPARMPGTDEVCFYADLDFGGEALCVTMGTVSPVLEAEWNDRFSSLRLGANATVEVCADIDFGACQVFDINVARLPVGLNDAVSSYRTPAGQPEVRAPERPRDPAANEVCFYADGNFAGDFFCATTGTDTRLLPPEWDNRISSLRIGTGASVQICSSGQFTGSCAILTRDVLQLPGNLNNGVSSFRIPAPN